MNCVKSWKVSGSIPNYRLYFSNSLNTSVRIISLALTQTRARPAHNAHYLGANFEPTAHKMLNINVLDKWLTVGGEAVSLLSAGRALLPIFYCSFLLEAESTPGP